MSKLEIPNLRGLERKIAMQKKSGHHKWGEPSIDVSILTWASREVRILVKRFCECGAERREWFVASVPYYKWRRESCMELNAYELELERKEMLIERNLRLALKLLGEHPSYRYAETRKLDKVARRRLQFAIYRLHLLNVSPKEIANTLNLDETYVKTCIANTFKEECLRSDLCIFKTLFLNRK
jgi:hypothetical protein